MSLLPKREIDVMTRVKICGLMNHNDIDMAVSAGADSLGFVTEYPVEVPWNISRKRSAELVSSAPPFVTTTAVVGGAMDEIVAIAHTVKPHFLQLHVEVYYQGSLCHLNLHLSLQEIQLF